MVSLAVVFIELRSTQSLGRRERVSYSSDMVGEMCRGRYIGVLRPGCPRRFVMVVRGEGSVCGVCGVRLCKIFEIEIRGDGLYY